MLPCGKFYYEKKYIILCRMWPSGRRRGLVRALTCDIAPPVRVDL